ncbi:hypothetical protein [Mycobacteroides abscessus]|uniref:hypothetical protein n=1 Tax=Mycobacteroides abscessus TaxID=36809 RepID=UPI0002DB441A|nr:hypothetical protein [Mycobacteroides abscessus]
MNITEYIEVNDIGIVNIEDHGYARDEDGWDHRAYTVTLENADGFRFTTPWRAGMAITTRPSAEEVADSLVSEVSAYRDAGSFESWADEFGYDSDSRKAEKLYNQVGAQVDGVVTLFGGSDKFDHVAHNVDRL